MFREGPEAAVYHVPGDVPCKVTGPVDHRDQGSNGDTDQAEFQDEGDCGHEVKDGFDLLTQMLEYKCFIRDENWHNIECFPTF